MVYVKNQEIKKADSTTESATNRNIIISYFTIYAVNTAVFKRLRSFYNTRQKKKRTGWTGVSPFLFLAYKVLEKWKCSRSIIHRVIYNIKRIRKTLSTLSCVSYGYMVRCGRWVCCTCFWPSQRHRKHPQNHPNIYPRITPCTN